MKITIEEYQKFISAVPYFSQNKEEMRLGAAFCEMYSIKDDDLFWADNDDDVKDIILTNYIQ